MAVLGVRQVEVIPAEVRSGAGSLANSQTLRRGGGALGFEVLVHGGVVPDQLGVRLERGDLCGPIMSGRAKKGG